MTEEMLLLWPERPTCHDHDPLAQRFDMPVWRAPRDDWGGFRTCSFCGSIHPEDLHSALLRGAILHGSDWKYGWPHKFYVDGIPNSNAGKLRNAGGVSCSRGLDPFDVEQQKRILRAGGRIEEEWKNGVLVRISRLEPQEETTNGKWYNIHLQDLNDLAFSALAEALMKHSNIQFYKKDGKLMYLAPRAGYQKT